VRIDREGRSPGGDDIGKVTDGDGEIHGDFLEGAVAKVAFFAEADGESLFAEEVGVVGGEGVGGVGGLAGEGGDEVLFFLGVD